MNPHPSPDMITPDTALITKHAGWDAARTGKPAWIIDDDDGAKKNWFKYTRSGIEQMHYIRSLYCKALIKGDTL